MATVSANVNAAPTGVVSYAPLGTALPTTPTAALNVAFVEVGYLDESGVVESDGRSINKVKAWQNSAVVRTLQTEQTLTYKLVMMETNSNSLPAYFDVYTAGVGKITGAVAPHKSWVFHVDDGTYDIRIVVPDGQVTERGDISIIAGDVIKYPLTIEAFPDVNGVKAYWYFATATVSA